MLHPNSCERCDGAMVTWPEDAWCVNCGWSGPTRAPSADERRPNSQPTRYDQLNAGASAYDAIIRDRNTRRRRVAGDRKAS